MESASLADIKRELNGLGEKRLNELLLRVAKYKKENKEFLSYLLFDAADEEEYIRMICEELDTLFTEVNLAQVYLAKKTIRKALRIATKHIKFSGQKTTEVEVLLHFCKKMDTLPKFIRRAPIMDNLYLRQIVRMRKAIDAMHEDLQYDYEMRLERELKA